MLAVVSALANHSKLRGLEIKLIHQNTMHRVRGDSDHLRNIIENAILGSPEAVSLTEIHSGTETMAVAWECVNDEVKITIYNPLEEYADDRRQQIRTVGGMISGECVSRICMEYLYWSVSSMLLERYNGALFARPDPKGGVKTILSFEMEQMQASPSEKLPVGGLSLDKRVPTVKSVTGLPFKLSILVAEDDLLARTLMATVLEHMSQECHCATNGREVLDLVSQSTSYYLILMDIDMPIMDGLSASIALRNGEAGEFGTKVPIVAVTAFNTLSDESRLKKAGMNYFLSKPVKIKHLRELLLEVVRSE